jgi:hypothetical protein
MGKISGKGGKVMYGSVVVAEQVSWSMSGITMPTTTAPTEFGATGTKVKEVADIPDAGTLEFNGNFDPNDTTGQEALATVCLAGTHLTNLYLYANTSTFWRVGTGGYIVVTKAQSITLPRNNFGTISFSGDISTAAMEKVGTGS